MWSQPATYSSIETSGSSRWVFEPHSVDCGRLVNRSLIAVDTLTELAEDLSLRRDLWRHSPGPVFSRQVHTHWDWTVQWRRRLPVSMIQLVEWQIITYSYIVEFLTREKAIITHTQSDTIISLSESLRTESSQCVLIRLELILPQTSSPGKEETDNTMTNHHLMINLPHDTSTAFTLKL